MKLYYSPGACSLAAHIALREAERRFDLERVDLKTHLTASGADYTQINPKRYVPALQLDGETLTENVAILLYIADLAPEKRLAPPAGTFARYHLVEWLAFIATELHKQFFPLFTPGVPLAVESKLRGKVGDRLLYVQEVLGDRAYLLGETFTIADAYLFVMLQWSARWGVDLQLFPNLETYEYHVAERPAVQEAMRVEGLQLRHSFKRSA